MGAAAGGGRVQNQVRTPPQLSQKLHPRHKTNHRHPVHAPRCHHPHLGDDKGDHEFEVRAGLVYSNAGAICQMDLFIPQGATAAVPCVLVIQGGGFRAQNGQKFKPFAEYLAAYGIAAALIGYRGQPDHIYPATLADLRTAIRFVRKISAEHGIDPDQIGAMGRSAGATIAALLATSNFDEDGARDQRSRQVLQVLGRLD